MTTAEDIFDGFRETMSGLVKGLQVIHITTPTAQLLCCQHDDDVAAVFSRPDIKQFDQIPVKKGDAIIGLLTRHTYIAGTTGPASTYMHPLGENILVSADTQLLDFLQSESLDRLVISGTKMYGLVTRSDFLKLPVRLLAFALVTHIEVHMVAMIQSTGVQPEVWIDWLESENRERVKRKFSQLLHENSDLDILELTTFYDKQRILQALLSLEKYPSLLPQRKLIGQLSALTQLRNTVAHSGGNVDDDYTLQLFITRLHLAYNWIREIEGRKKSASDACN